MAAIELEHLEKLCFPHHAAFTDLIFFQNRLYLCYREGESHLSYDGHITICCSRDGMRWEKLQVLEVSGYDLRDPKWFVFNDRLWLIIPARDGMDRRENFLSLLEMKKSRSFFSRPRRLPLSGVVAWRPKIRGRKILFAGYTADFQSPHWRVYLFTTKDLARFHREVIANRHWVNETEICLLPNATKALVRVEYKPALLAIRKRCRWEYRNLNVSWQAPVWKTHKGYHFIGVREMTFEDEKPSVQCKLYFGPSLQKLSSFLLTEKGFFDAGYCGLAFFKNRLFLSLYRGSSAKTQIWIYRLRLARVQRRVRFH